MTSSVRISELPTSDILNDDDFIIINTQNVVTQGIQASDFIDSLSSRTLTVTGDRTFAGTLTCDGATTINAPLVCNDTVTFNGAASFTRGTDLRLQDLADISNTTPQNDEVLIYNSAESEYQPGTPTFQIPYLDVAPGIGPSNRGDVYINTNDNKLYVFTGVEWVATS